MTQNIISLECPNCGAPFAGFICEYCGSALREIWSGYEGRNLYANAASTSPDVEFNFTVYPGATGKVRSFISSRKE